jgi:hypothetical protein
MKMTFGIAVAVLAASTVACSRDTTTANRTASGANGAARATLTGCLVSGEQPDTYVLRLASAADTASPGTSSSTPSASNDSTAGRAFRVVADKTNDLSDNLNMRVAVNGYVESSASTVGTTGAANQGQTASAAPGATASGSAATAGTTGSGMQVLRAESVRKVGDRCTEDAPLR